jgi:hypothetical protein
LQSTNQLPEQSEVVHLIKWKNIFVWLKLVADNVLEALRFERWGEICGPSGCVCGDDVNMKTICGDGWK